MRHMTTASAAALAIGAAAHAQEPMSHYDADGDGHISSAEFAAYASADLGDLDTDRSGGISADEYASADFARYDQNQDEMLNRDEYHASMIGIDALRGVPVLGRAAGSRLRIAGSVSPGLADEPLARRLRPRDAHLP